MVDENNINHKSRAFVVHETQYDASTREPITSTFVNHTCQVLFLVFLLVFFLASPSTFKATSITPPSQNLQKKGGRRIMLWQIKFDINLKNVYGV
jgi:hypothetical protein